MLTEQGYKVQRTSHERDHPCCHAPLLRSMVSKIWRYLMKPVKLII